MFKLNVSPTSVLHPKITIRCHHLTLWNQDFGTGTAVEEWLAINTNVHYHARLVARKISGCQTTSRDTIGWTFILLFLYRVDNSNRDNFKGKLDERDLFSWGRFWKSYYWCPRIWCPILSECCDDEIHVGLEYVVSLHRRSAQRGELLIYSQIHVLSWFLRQWQSFLLLISGTEAMETFSFDLLSLDARTRVDGIDMDQETGFAKDPSILCRFRSESHKCFFYYIDQGAKWGWGYVCKGAATGCGLPVSIWEGYSLKTMMCAWTIAIWWSRRLVSSLIPDLFSVQGLYN